MKCIYCGSEDLSKSDVIPDALTNGKIINPCVCRIAHNNRFSDLFEADVIKAFAVITNELDVKSSKGKGKYASYETTIGVDGENYKARISSGSELFTGNKIIRSEDGKHLLGPIDEIRKIKNAKESDIRLIDINEAIVSQRISLDFSIFFSESINRLVSKIAFEWFCLRNKIEDKYEVFDDVIEYIVSGQKKRTIVEMVANKELYAEFNFLAGFGSHVLLSYVDINDFVHIIVDLFGIAIYDVAFCKKNDLCKYNANFQMISLDAKQKHFSYMDINDAAVDFNNSFRDVNIGSIVCKVPINLLDNSLNEKCTYIRLYDFLEKGLTLTSSTELMMPLLLRNVQDVLQASALTVRGLRRFVKEHRDYIDSKQGLNPKATNKRDIFLFYIVYVVGKTEGINSLSDLNNYLRENIGEGEIKITEDNTKTFLQDMLKDENYISYIIIGAAKIEEWTL